MESVTNSAQLQALLKDHEFNFLYQCGYTKPIDSIKLSEKDQLIRCVWLHHVLFQPHAELDQLRKGLYNTLQFDHLVHSHAKEVWGLFAASDVFDVTPKYLCDEFAIQYSPNGSNTRTSEQAVVMLWFDYVTDCANDDYVTIGDILKFISGSSKIPATGFDSIPKIKFTNEDCLPTASTCDLAITFPRKMAHLSPKEFKAKMDFCILGSHGFGIV